jgi:hypothetical protein
MATVKQDPNSLGRRECRLFAAKLDSMRRTQRKAAQGDLLFPRRLNCGTLIV